MRKQTSGATRLSGAAKGGFYRAAADNRLLGTLPDADVARRIGRPVHGVRIKRTRLGIPTARDGRRRENRDGKPRAKRRESWPNDYRGPRYTRTIRR